MANKKQSTLLEKLRKAFMTRDSDTFEKVANEMTGDEGEGEAGNGQPQIHIHVPGAAGDPKPGAVAATGDDDAGGAADPLTKVLDAIKAVDGKIDAVAARVTKLEGGGTPTGDDDDEDDGTGTTDDDEDDGTGTTDDDEDDGTGTTDDDGTGAGGGDGGQSGTKTGDSTALRDEFQDALSRAEILAPGVRLPTFDAKAVRKKTVDAICVLRRRALRAAMDNENAEAVRAVTGGADISGMPCNAVQAFFNAASELVRGKNSGVTQRRTNDSAQSERKDINQIHADFWKTRK